MPHSKKLLAAAAIFTVLVTPGAASAVTAAPEADQPAALTSGTSHGPIPSNVIRPDDEPVVAVVSGKSPAQQSTAVSEQRQSPTAEAASVGDEPADKPASQPAPSPISTVQSPPPTAAAPSATPSATTAPTTPAQTSAPTSSPTPSSSATAAPTPKATTDPSPKATAAPSPKDSASSPKVSATPEPTPTAELSPFPNADLFVSGTVTAEGSAPISLSDLLLPPTPEPSSPTDEADALIRASERANAQTPRDSAGPQSFVVSDQVAASELDRASYAVKVYPKYSYPVPPVGVPSGYGPRECDPGQPCSTFHEGLDFANAPGTIVKAVADGVVVFAGYDGNYGNVVRIEHNVNGDVFTTVSAHLEDYSLPVSAGMTVRRGDAIGSVGNTGRSYGAHLHFEVRYNDTAVHPGIWLDERAYPYPA